MVQSLACNGNVSSLQGYFREVIVKCVQGNLVTVCLTTQYPIGTFNFRSICKNHCIKSQIEMSVLADISEAIIEPLYKEDLA